MRVLVFDSTRGGGHSFNYHRVLLPALAELTDDVTVVVGKGILDLPSTQVQIKNLPERISWEASIPVDAASILKRSFVARRVLLDIVRRHKPDQVYIPTADSLSQVMGVMGALGQNSVPAATEFEAVLHRCGFAYRAPSFLKNALYRAGFFGHRNAPWNRFLTVDVVAYDWIQKHGGELARRNVLLPDPVEDWRGMDRQEARKRLRLAEEGPWIGCVGAIDERKGIDHLLAAFRRPSVSSRARLLLAGQHSPGVREVLRSDCGDLVRSGRIVNLDRFLSVDELKDSISALDLVCTPYAKQIALASIVLRSAAAERPVLATSFGWCGRIVPTFELGWTTSVFDTDRFAQDIGTCLDRLPDWRPSPESQRLIEYHSPANFSAVFTSRLRERLGLQPDPRVIPWTDVDRRSRVRAASSC